MPNIIDTIVGAAKAPAQARADQYAKVLDSALAEQVDDDARLTLCKAQEASWIAKYEAFCEAVDSGRYKGSATSYDYLATLAVITARIARFRPAPTQPNTEFWQGAQA